MLSRILNLPIRALGRAARAVKDAETQKAAAAPPPPAGRSSATLRVGSPMDVPADLVLGDMVLKSADLVAAIDAGTPIAIIDVRSDSQFHQGRPVGALHMPDEEAVAHIAEIPAGHRMIVVGDKKGEHARRVAAFLRFRGLEDAWVLAGGYAAWKKAGLPVQAG